MRKLPLTMLPPGMDGRYNNKAYGKDNALQEWQRNAVQTISRTLETPAEQQSSTRTLPSHSTIRAVTPDSVEEEDISDGQPAANSDNPGAPSSHTSPRSILGEEKSREHRQGLGFRDTLEGRDSSPNQNPTPARLRSSELSSPPLSNTRPRTRTLEEPRRPRQQATVVSRSRHRIGSVHSTTSTALLEEKRPNVEPASSLDLPLVEGSQSSQLEKSDSIRAKPRNTTRRLKKKPSQSSQGTSSPAPSPTVDSLPVPVETANANKILRLMKLLSGRMRGAVEYQSTSNGPWVSGICSIDDMKGVLVYEVDEQGPFYQIVVPDLRGCRVNPTISSEKHGKCLEISTVSGLRVQILPSVSIEFDHWLAALLCWQQIGPGTSQINLSMPDVVDVKTETFSRGSAHNSVKDGNIIKVGKLLLWDKGVLMSPTSILRRSITKDGRSARRSWRRVSCILQDNGEFKLLTENDVTLLSVIQLSQLSRSAIQRLDRSVLNEAFTIAIFPQYASTSTSISIIRPVYIALESRILFEVWFVLLRAFTIPELYGPQHSAAEMETLDNTQGSDSFTTFKDMFRMEKSLHVRIVEAKIRRSVVKSDSSIPAKHSSLKADSDPATGDYLAEVILDGEVRLKTMTKTDTKTPFWREDCEFLDLPATLPTLSVILKKVSAPSEVSALGARSSTSIHGPDHRIETICGVVEIPLDQLERDKDYENWWPILDDKQESIGEMFLKIHHDEMVVMMAKDYQPISELLHRFSNGLTVQISQVVPSKLRPLSETLMNIFQVSGQSISWLMALVEDEIDGIGKDTPPPRFRFSRRVGSNDSFDSASDRELSVRDMGKSLTGEANLLFRGNSLLTQALDFHMRRVGKEYLEEVLLDKITEINTLNPYCEVDPSRLGHGDDLNKNWAQLIALTTGLWDSIATSAKRCPAELRQILKFIRAVADDRYGDFLRAVPYTSVSGFLFLRFFCPAILNPKLFGLLRDHPQSKAQRTLTLIAKSLQVLANQSSFGQKEAWMEPMNRFITGHRQAVKDFIDDICSISTDRNVFSVPASYSTPITILGRLPSTSKEGFPSLPYLIDHARNFAILIKLWLDSTSNYVAPQDLHGDLLDFHKQCLALQRRTAECVLKAEQAARLNDQNPSQGDDIETGLSHVTSHTQSFSNSSSVATIDFDTSIPKHSRFPPFTPIVSYDISHAAMAPKSAGSESSNKDRYERQTYWEPNFGRDSKFEQKPYEPEDTVEVKPPSRGASRNGKASKGFLSGLRKKGVEKGASTKDKDKDVAEQRPASSWNGETT